MKVAIMYSPQHEKLKNAAKALGKTLEAGGHHVAHLHINRNERAPNVGRYDMVYVGSVAEGTVGGKIPIEVSAFIKQCRGFQNTRSAAFLIKRIFFNTKGLKRLMAVLESAGSRVIDFQIIGRKSDPETLGKRLKS